MYTDFASVYDRLMADVPYREWADYYAGLLKAGGVLNGPIVECACGTGSLTVELARRYPRITGVTVRNLVSGSEKVLPCDTLITAL